MNQSKRLEKIKTHMDSLAKEISGLQQELQSGKKAPAEEQEEMKSLRETLRSLYCYLSLDFQIGEDTLLKIILQCAMHVVQARGAGLTLYDRERKKLIFKAATGEGADGVIGYEVPLEGSVHGLAFATGEVQASTPLHTKVDAHVNVHFRNVLVAPLIARNESIGTISAVNKEGTSLFTSQDMTTYKLFADLAAHVVKQRLHEHLLKHILQGKPGTIPPELNNIVVDKKDLTLMELIQNIVTLTQGNEKMLDYLKQLTLLLKNISHHY